MRLVHHTLFRLLHHKPRALCAVMESRRRSLRLRALPPSRPPRSLMVTAQFLLTVQHQKTNLRKTLGGGGGADDVSMTNVCQ